jgi:hypothetical protein
VRAWGGTPPHSVKAVREDSATICATTNGTPASCHRVTVSWKAPNVDNVSAYHVYRIPYSLTQSEAIVGNPVPVTPAGGVPGSTLTFTDPTELPNDVTFGYYVRAALDTNPMSPASNIAKVQAIDSFPIANNDAYTTPSNTPLVVNLVANGVLKNDTDMDSTTSIQVDGVLNPATGQYVAPGTEITLPSGSKVTLAVNGTFVYTPATGFNSSESFTYRASNGRFSGPPEEPLQSGVNVHMNKEWPAGTLTLDEATVMITVGGGKGGKK